MYGSSGSLLPQVQLRLIDENGVDIEEHEKPGEVLLKGPNIISGYLNDPEATATLIDSEGWLHSGDVGLIRLSPQQNEHLVIVDRLRDMIKVKVRLNV
jgi:long-subunit acyl-CoA synthetase (AMP-forming)